MPPLLNSLSTSNPPTRFVNQARNLRLVPLSPFPRATICERFASLQLSGRSAHRHSFSGSVAVASSYTPNPGNTNVIYPFVTYPASPPFLGPDPVIHSLSTYGD